MASAPRWVNALNDALAQPANKGNIIYQVATVDARNAPHVRSQVHRAFTAPDARPDLPLLLTSTDVRSPKVLHLLANPAVELAWWLDGSHHQFRLAGFAHIVPAPPEPGAPFLFPPIPADALALRTLDAQDYDWEAKRRELFDSMSPAMRASWCVPAPPGSALGSYEEQSQWPSAVPHELKTEEDRKNAELALKNFALMLIEPVSVDWVELGVKPNRRTIFTRREDGAWSEHLAIP